MKGLKEKNNSAAHFAGTEEKKTLFKMDVSY